MEREKSAAEIYYDMIERCEERTLEYLNKLVMERAYNESIKDKGVKILTKKILLTKKSKK